MPIQTGPLKRFAQQARIKLITQIGARLDYVLQNAESPEIKEKPHQLQALQKEIKSLGREALIDKVAYTWFNRFMALRFMDANNYQPLHLKVLTPVVENGYPQILAEANAGNIPDDLQVDKTRIFDLLNGKINSATPQDEVYKELLIASCNQLHDIMPFLFEKIDDYTELLLPQDLLSPFSIVADMVNGMNDDDCTEVEIIGWLYQFYISEKKDEVFASKKSVKKEDIPAATQLFTPRWIVEYMVQNTVGKLWLQNRPNSRLRDHMEYYIESPSSQSEDYLELNSIEELTLLDQACGSGHILVYGFDLLYKIYEEEGYNPSKIPELIISKNLHGFEIDERAAQLAAMAIMMKARSYNRRFFKKAVKPNILRYRDVSFEKDELEEVLKLTNAVSDELKYDLKTLEQATNFGSLIIPKTSEKILENVLQEVHKQLPKADLFRQESLGKLRLAVEQLLPLSRKYHCVVDNPPYMGSGNMNTALSDYVKTNYPKSKADLMACFMEAGIAVLYPKGFLGMINQHSWMFLSSYENLRKKLIESTFFDTNLHLGPRTFPEIGGEVVQNAAFTFWNTTTEEKGVYIRLVDFGSTELKRENTIKAINDNNCGWFYTASQKDFKKIPGENIGYWLSPNVFKIFGLTNTFNSFAQPKAGITSGNNERFLFEWTEVSISQIDKKFYFHAKGGERRKWFGNNNLIINYNKNNLENFKKYNGFRHDGSQLYFKPGLTWAKMPGDFFNARVLPVNFVFDSSGTACFPSEIDKFLLLGLLNSKPANYLFKLLNPTLSVPPGVVSLLPIPNNLRKINEVLVKENISLSSNEYDIRETSRDFQQNELIRCKSNCGQNAADLDMLDEDDRNDILSTTNVPTDPNLLEDCYNAYQSEWKRKFFQLHQNEEELNRQFIEIYGLQEELTPDVPLEDITILKEETSIVDGQLVFHADEVFRQFMSYAVGCMFGRYSLDKEGLILANQGETLQDYLLKVYGENSTDTERSRPVTERSRTVTERNAKVTERSRTVTERSRTVTERSRSVPDEDNIIPILDDEWFEDDIVGKFHQFLKASFGTENFDKNLTFVEECLGKDIRKYFVKDFYKDHIKRYKKRPIYWMFSSPKGAFNVLIYMHRYKPSTLHEILNGYLREFKEKLTLEVRNQNHISQSGTANERTKADRRITELERMLQDVEAYEEMLYPIANKQIAIDLDDGVLVNYNKFGKVITEVTGLNDKKKKDAVKKFDWIDSSTII